MPVVLYACEYSRLYQALYFQQTQQFALIVSPESELVIRSIIEHVRRSRALLHFKTVHYWSSRSQYIGVLVLVKYTLFYKFVVFVSIANIRCYMICGRFMKKSNRVIYASVKLLFNEMYKRRKMFFLVCCCTYFTSEQQHGYIKIAA